MSSQDKPTPDDDRLQSVPYTELTAAEKRFNLDLGCPAGDITPSREDPRAFQRVTLEMSLKPFYDPSDQHRDVVLKRMFQQWYPLCIDADRVAIQLWVGDGSEILEYRGNLEDPFEWACYQGKANDFNLGSGESKEAESQHPPGDPEGRGLHSRAYLYRSNPPTFTYAWLKSLVHAIKEIGNEILGKPIEVGDTFDSTGEFCFSHFKYKRHREICLGGALYENTFVGCAARLKADPLPYAAFSNGIPEGTPLGTFLGKQIKTLHHDIGFDFIWFSNGFGFGAETWGLNGALFDGKSFFPERTAETAKGIRDFWRYFREECPTLPIRTRGTNLSACIDMASDAVPFSDILSDSQVEPPVNSPWAAIDGDFGLELVGWMTHIAQESKQGYPFRFYVHDPWWMNSPWLERYQRQPHDINLPLSVAKIAADGSVEPPSNLSIITVDNSHGEMPEGIPLEVASYIMKARETYPDQPGPLVWLYPLDEYHEHIFEQKADLSEIYFNDWYVRGCINEGLPLNTIVTTKNYLSSLEIRPELFDGSILFTPIPQINSYLRSLLFKHTERGGSVVFYGPVDVDDEEMLKLFGLQPGTAIDGDLPIIFHDSITKSSFPNQFRHSSLMAGGPLTLIQSDSKEPTRLLAYTESEGQKYPLAVQNTSTDAGKAIWLRAGVTCDAREMPGPLPPRLDPKVYFHTEALARLSCQSLRLHIDCQKNSTAERTPVVTISRHRNAFIYNGYCPGVIRSIEYKTHYGSPIFVNKYTEFDHGKARYQPEFTWRHECRLFVEQNASGIVRCQELGARFHGMRRRLFLTGLDNATVCFFPETGFEDKVEILVDPQFPFVTGDFLQPDLVQSAKGAYMTVGPVSGDVLFSWRG